MLDTQTGWVQGGAAVAWAVLESTRGSGILTGPGSTTAVVSLCQAQPLRQMSVLEKQQTIFSTYADNVRFSLHFI